MSAITKAVQQLPSRVALTEGGVQALTKSVKAINDGRYLLPYNVNASAFVSTNHIAIELVAGYAWQSVSIPVSADITSWGFVGTAGFIDLQNGGLKILVQNTSSGAVNISPLGGIVGYTVACNFSSPISVAAGEYLSIDMDYIKMNTFAVNALVIGSGPDGPPGPQGPQGPQGDPGTGINYGGSSGGSSFCVGSNTIPSASTGNNNIAISTGNCLYSVTTGQRNLAFGLGSLYNCTTGYQNITHGVNSLFAVTSGRDNIGIGDSAGAGVTTGNLNVFLGNSCGNDIVTGSRNFCVNNPSANFSNCVVLDMSGTLIPTGDGQVIFNLPSTASTTAPVVYDASSGQVKYSTSSRQFKDNIRSIETDTSSIYNIEPVTYEAKEDGSTHIGFIAEQVHDVNPYFSYLKDGEVHGVNQYAMMVCMVAELQKLRSQVSELQGLTSPALKKRKMDVDN